MRGFLEFVGEDSKPCGIYVGGSNGQIGSLSKLLANDPKELGNFGTDGLTCIGAIAGKYWKLIIGQDRSISRNRPRLSRGARCSPSLCGMSQRCDVTAMKISHIGDQQLRQAQRSIQFFQCPN